MSGFRVVLWKELIDLSRDYKTIAYVVLMPLIILPAVALFIGGLYSVQTIRVAVVDLDGGEGAEVFISYLEEELDGLAGVRVELLVAGSLEEAQGSHVVIVIPEGFTEALASLDGVAVLEVSRQAVVVAAEQAVQAVLRAASRLESQVAVLRVEELAVLAGVEVDPRGLLNPLEVKFAYHTAGGAPAGAEAPAAAVTARILIFSLFFVVNPALVFMSDAIVGERERRTIEKLLLAPASLRDILLGKAAASVVLSTGAAVADSIALVAFFAISGVGLTLAAPVLASWLASVVLLVFMTTAMAAVVAARSESIRSAQAGSALLMIIAIIVFSSALAVDYASLPTPVQALLQVIPFTHAALAVYYAALGDILRSVIHVAIQALLSAALALAAARLVDEEKLVLVR